MRGIDGETKGDLEAWYASCASPVRRDNLVGHRIHVCIIIRHMASEHHVFLDVSSIVIRQKGEDQPVACCRGGHAPVGVREGGEVDKSRLHVARVNAHYLPLVAGELQDEMIEPSVHWQLKVKGVEVEGTDLIQEGIDGGRDGWGGGRSVDDLDERVGGSNDAVIAPCNNDASI